MGPWTRESLLLRPAAVSLLPGPLGSGFAGSLSSGLHHARRAGGDGYCAVNGLALAVLTFLVSAPSGC